jgi:hypothetical protein
VIADGDVVHIDWEDAAVGSAVGDEATFHVNANKKFYLYV